MNKYQDVATAAAGIGWTSIYRMVWPCCTNSQMQASSTPMLFALHRSLHPLVHHTRPSFQNFTFASHFLPLPSTTNSPGGIFSFCSAITSFGMCCNHNNDRVSINILRMQNLEHKLVLTSPLSRGFLVLDTK